MLRSLVGSEMCIRDRVSTQSTGAAWATMGLRTFMAIMVLGTAAGENTCAKKQLPDWCSQTNIPSLLDQVYGDEWGCVVHPDYCTEGFTRRPPSDWEQICDQQDPHGACQYTAGAQVLDSAGSTFIAFQISEGAVRSFHSDVSLRTPIQVVDITQPTDLANMPTDLYEEPLNQPPWLPFLVTQPSPSESRQFLELLQLPAPSTKKPRPRRYKDFEDFNQTYGPDLDQLWRRSQTCNPTIRRIFEPGVNRERSWYGLQQWMDPNTSPGALIGFGSKSWVALSSFKAMEYPNTTDPSMLPCSRRLSVDYLTSSTARDCASDSCHDPKCSQCHWPWKILNTSNSAPAVIKAPEGWQFLALKVATNASSHVLVYMLAKAPDAPPQLWEFGINTPSSGAITAAIQVNSGGKLLGGYKIRELAGGYSGQLGLMTALRSCQFNGGFTQRERLVVAVHDRTRVAVSYTHLTLPTKRIV
eukprot:TRINITY_DN21826_c0_g1_i1.p1 TRINITY_DN21826_c0_g1~~TRINITY_DN21826_c0_g1_i1.p1  ORF type:complete len:506 (+),score=93.80 TRINITY_DN21826_c0_g1_i1:111-1520(+)